MNQKISSVVCLAIAYWVLVPPANSFAIKSFLNKIIHPLAFLFPKKENSTKEIENNSSFLPSNGLDCNRTFSADLDDFKLKIAVIYPGTKWCGSGNISKSSDDLGPFSKSDKCCRAHDMCPESIPAGSSKYGLRNTGLFTRSHCDCDNEFHDCLKAANTTVSKSIGITYFTVLRPDCFREDYPVTGCAQYQNDRCIEYRYDTNGEKKYQWFDNPTF